MKVAFLDRDGVINREVNHLHKIVDFNYVPKTKQALRNLKELGYQIIVVTNQAGIAKGFFTEEDYYRLSRHYFHDLFDSGITLLDIIHCPHHPNAVLEKYRASCFCRKPGPGMLLHAINKYSVDVEKSILVGDKVSDMEAAVNAGIKNYFLVESGHKISQEDYVKYSVFKSLYEVSIDREIVNKL